MRLYLNRVSPMPLNRRTFLKTSALSTAALMLPRGAKADYGDLVRDPEGVLDLPAGFSYTILDHRGEPMDDGYKVPGKPTGMACVEDSDGNWILIRNHELDETDSLIGPYDSGQSAPETAYDSESLGGASRVVIDPSDLSITSRNMLLLGTAENGGGCPSPWGWLSGERSVTRNHGLVFLCDPEASTADEPKPIPAMGRFRHGGGAVDGLNRVYLTEDRPQGSFYRMTPLSASDPFAGSLEALVVVGENSLDTSGALSMGDVVAIEWIAIDEPSPETDTVRDEAQSKGAAIFTHANGVWADEDSIWFCATEGGPVNAGQVFRLHVSEGTLECVLASTNTWVIDMPKSITVAPWGEVFFGEDGTADQYIRGIDTDGLLFDFAYNQSSTGGIGGACFSPDSSVLFVNLPKDHITLAIEGPFPYEGRGLDSGNGPGPEKDADSACGCASSRNPFAPAVLLAAIGTFIVRRGHTEKGG